MGEHFYENLKVARELKGLSQKEVADMVGVAKSTYSLYESGNREPNVQTIKKIADVLSTSADMLLGIDDVVQTITPIEMKNLVNKYRVLDNHGKKMVDFTLQSEWERSTSKLEEGQLSFSFDSDHSFNIIKNGKPVPYDSRKHTANAANAISGASKEDQEHDNDIMNGDDF